MGNHALDLNPPQADLHLSTNGSDWLWAAFSFIAFFAASLAAFSLCLALARALARLIFFAKLLFSDCFRSDTSSGTLFQQSLQMYCFGAGLCSAMIDGQGLSEEGMGGRCL